MCDYCGDDKIFSFKLKTGTNQTDPVTCHKEYHERRFELCGVCITEVLIPFLAGHDLEPEFIDAIRAKLDVTGVLL